MSDIGNRFGSFFQDTKGLFKNFSWDNLKNFSRGHWVEIIIILLVIIFTFSLISKVFEIFVKLAIMTFLVWLLYMIIFNRQGLKEMFNSFH